jgi:predicted  nucleic acid-binding Zn-ribbon protein
MAGPALTVREIHRLLQHAEALKSSIDNGPRRLKAQKTAVAKAEEELHQAQDAIKMLKVGIHEREVSVKAGQEQIRKYEKQLNDITSKKEYDALKAEVASTKEKIRVLEDEILTVMMEVDEKTGRLPECESAVKKAKAEFAEFEREYEARVDMWKKEREDTLKQITVLEVELPEDVRPQYDRVIKTMGADGLAAVEGRHCTACYTEMTNQVLHNLQVKEFVMCRSCYRVLYVKFD